MLEARRRIIFATWCWHPITVGQEQTKSANSFISNYLTHYLSSYLLGLDTLFQIMIHWTRLNPAFLYNSALKTFENWYVQFFVIVLISFIFISRAWISWLNMFLGLETIIYDEIKHKKIQNLREMKKINVTQCTLIDLNLL